MSDEDREALDIIDTLVDVAAELWPLPDERGLAFAIAMDYGRDLERNRRSPFVSRQVP